jgi:hypothetical protein
MVSSLFSERQPRAFCFSIAVLVFTSVAVSLGQSQASDRGSSSQIESSQAGIHRSLDHVASAILQRAERADVVLRAQRLREEGEQLMTQGKTEMAGERFQSALKLLQSTSESKFALTGLSGEFEFKLKSELQSVLGPPKTREADFTPFGLPGDRIGQFIRFFQGRGKATFLRTSRRAVIYRSIMETIFREEGLPPELIYQAQIESGFDPLALSSANARGLWQFIPETGRRYGLRQTKDVDERIDPAKSTRAAARHLRDLYNRFQNWHLALAAFNAGEMRIAAAIAKAGVHNFWELSRRRLLPSETAAYVPAVLAVIALQTALDPMHPLPRPALHTRKNVKELTTETRRDGLRAVSVWQDTAERRPEGRLSLAGHRRETALRPSLLDF